MSGPAVRRGIPRPLVRGNQLFIVLSVIVAYALQAPVFILLALAVQVLGVAGGPGVQPVFAVVRAIYGVEQLQQAPKEAAGAQRFNNILAVLFFTTSAAGLYLIESPALGWGAAAAVAAAAAAAIAGFCFGCHIYAFLHQRLGLSLEPNSGERSSA